VKRFIIFFLLALAAVARAQTEGPRTQSYQEVERGLWLRTTFGMTLSLTNHFGTGRSSSVWPPGPMVNLELGYDLGQVASLNISLLGEQLVGSRQVGERGDIPNDAAVMGLLAGGRFNLVTTKRMALFVKAQAGYAMAFPASSELKNGFLVAGGAGVEYATALRHFFIGLETSAQYLIASSGLALTVTPMIRYTF